MGKVKRRPWRPCVPEWIADAGLRPDKQKMATQTVLEQAEVLSEAWAVA